MYWFSCIHARVETVKKELYIDVCDRSTVLHGDNKSQSKSMSSHKSIPYSTWCSDINSSICIYTCVYTEVLSTCMCVTLYIYGFGGKLT